MKRALLLVFIGFVTVFFLGYLWRLVNQPNKPIPDTSKEQQVIPLKTEVIKYSQTYIPTESKTGNCWTGSLASGSNKAWRCITENRVYDPCYETETGKLVCNVDPENPNSGFELKLTEALPKNNRENDIEGIPWRLALENGMKCSPITGTAGSIDGESIYILCSNNGFLIGETDPFLVSQDGYWMANVAYADSSFKKITKKETVKILKVWE